MDITDKFIEVNCKHKPRVPHRYSASELYGLLNGWTSPKQFLEGKRFTLEEAMRMRMGSAKHEIIQECLAEMGYELEKKVEYEHEGIVLVTKCDAITSIDFLEIKTSDKLSKGAKDWQLYQATLS